METWLFASRFGQARVSVLDLVIAHHSSILATCQCIVSHGQRTSMWHALMPPHYCIRRMG